MSSKIAGSQVIQSTGRSRKARGFNEPLASEVKGSVVIMGVTSLYCEAFVIRLGI